MPARHARSPRSVAITQVPRIKDHDTDRAVASLDSAIKTLQVDRKRITKRADLVVGSNHISHGLGRACEGCNVTPTVADDTFAFAIDRTNPRPDLEVWITVVGVDQPDATVEVY